MPTSPEKTRVKVELSFFLIFKVTDAAPRMWAVSCKIRLTSEVILLVHLNSRGFANSSVLETSESRNIGSLGGELGLSKLNSLVRNRCTCAEPKRTLGSRAFVAEVI